MTARLILACHAETDAIRRAAFADGEGLNERGRAAAGARTASLPDIDLALTSPASAAVETARAFGWQARVEDGLRDLDAGRWRGRTLADIAAADATAAQSWLTDPGFDGHGGESIAALIARMTTWLRDRRDIGGVTLAVTHASVVRAVLVGLLDAPATAFWRIESAPLTMAELGSDGRRWTLRALTR